MGKDPHKAPFSRHKIDIRRTKPSDLDQLVNLCAEHAHYEQSKYVQSGKSEALRQALFGQEALLYCLVVAMDVELVGYTTFVKQYATWDCAHYLYMDCLYIKEAYRGYGLGKRLLGNVSQSALAMGCKSIQWQTPALNKRAIAFYCREGALPKSKIRFYLDAV